MKEELCMRDRDVDKDERRANIRDPKYNGGYVRIVTDTVPKYLDRESMNKKKKLSDLGVEMKKEKIFFISFVTLCTKNY